MKRPSRALSIRQPFAENIFQGQKKLENRSVPTKLIGERVYIYAALTPEKGGEDLPRGVLVGTVEIAQCTWREGKFRWRLRSPIRLKRPLKPRNKPQPVWFRPF